MPGILPYLVCSALYLALAQGLRFHWLQTGERAPGLGGRLALLPVLPLLLHGWLLWTEILQGPDIFLGVGTSVSLILWLTAGIYWAGNLVYGVQGPLLLVLAITGALMWLPLALPPPRPLAHTELAAFRAHLLISLLAYSLLTVAAVQALLMALMERRLHGAVLPSPLRALPPLLTMERLLFRILLLGFILLTLTLGSGMLFSEEVFGRPLRFSHKVVFSIAAWGIFALLLAGRRIYGWRGRVALRWTLAGFLALVLAYTGSKFVLEVLLHR